VYRRLCSHSHLFSKYIAAVFDELGKIIEHNLGKKGPGV
jgi:hypothetical protein